MAGELTDGPPPTRLGGGLHDGTGLHDDELPEWIHPPRNAGSVNTDSSDLDRLIADIQKKLQTCCNDVNGLQQKQYDAATKQDEMESVHRSQIDCISKRVFDAERRLSEAQQLQDDAISKANAVFEKHASEVEQERQNLMSVVSQMNRNFEHLSGQIAQHETSVKAFQSDLLEVRESCEELQASGELNEYARSGQDPSLRQALSALEAELNGKLQDVQTVMQGLARDLAGEASRVTAVCRSVAALEETSARGRNELAAARRETAELHGDVQTAQALLEQVSPQCVEARNRVELVLGEQSSLRRKVESIELSLREQVALNSRAEETQSTVLMLKQLLAPSFRQPPPPPPLPSQSQEFPGGIAGPGAMPPMDGFGNVRERPRGPAANADEAQRFTADDAACMDIMAAVARGDFSAARPQARGGPPEPTTLAQPKFGGRFQAAAAGAFESDGGYAAQQQRGGPSYPRQVPDSQLFGERWDGSDIVDLPMGDVSDAMWARMRGEEDAHQSSFEESADLARMLSAHMAPPDASALPAMLGAPFSRKPHRAA